MLLNMNSSIKISLVHANIKNLNIDAIMPHPMIYGNDLPKYFTPNTFAFFKFVDDNVASYFPLHWDVTAMIDEIQPQIG